MYSPPKTPRPNLLAAEATLHSEIEEMQKNAPLLAEAMSVAFFGILEYAPGHPLMGLDGNQVLASPAPDMLTELGSLCALDVLINNLDRVPLPVWQNEGDFSHGSKPQSPLAVLG